LSLSMGKGLMVAVMMVVYVAASTYGLYKIKVASGWQDSQFILGFCAYGFGFILWLYILRSAPLSLAFPVAAGALITSTSVVGMTQMGEAASLPKIASIVLIVIGICLLYAFDRGTT